VKKYLEFFKASFKWSLENRLATLIWVFTGVFPVFIMFLIWSSVYSRGGQIGNLTLNQFVTYYFLIGIVNALAMSYRSEDIPRRIKDGDLARDLIRPYSFFFQELADELGYKMVSLFVSLPSFLLLFLFMGSDIEINASLPTLAVFTLFLAAAFALNILFDFLLSMAAFFTTTAWWIFHIKLIVTTIFGGLSFPLILFPQKIQSILRFLPFQYFVYYPTQILSEQQRFMVSDFILPAVIALVWIALFTFLYRMLWRLGLRRFTAIGT